MNTDAARIHTDQSVFIRAKSMFIPRRFCPGLRYIKNVIAPGAQTERRSDAGPVRTVLSGYDLTGRFSNPKSEILKLRASPSSCSQALLGNEAN